MAHEHRRTTCRTDGHGDTGRCEALGSRQERAASQPRFHSRLGGDGHSGGEYRRVWPALRSLHVSRRLHRPAHRGRGLDVGRSVRACRRQDARLVHPAVRGRVNALYGACMGARGKPLAAGAQTVLADAVRASALFPDLARRHPVLLRDLRVCSARVPSDDGKKPTDPGPARLCGRPDNLRGDDGAADARRRYADGAGRRAAGRTGPFTGGGKTDRAR